MPDVQPISDLDDPRLRPFRTLRAQVDHLQEAVFVAEGDKVVRRLLLSPLEVRTILLPPRSLPTFEPLIAARADRPGVFVAERALLTQLTGFNVSQGLLALARVPDPVPMDALVGTPGPRFLVALDGLTHSENVGTVLRNAAAFGVQGVVVGETTAHPYLRRAVRSSMGTVFSLPYHVGPRLADTLRTLRAAGIRCLAADPHTPVTTDAADLTGDCCVVLGAEGDGIRPEVLAACDGAVAIPMAPGVDSLNVAAAAAVFFHEVARHRRTAPHPR